MRNSPIDEASDSKDEASGVPSRERQGASASALVPDLEVRAPGVRRVSVQEEGTVATPMASLELTAAGFPKGWFVCGSAEERWTGLVATLHGGNAKKFRLRAGWAPGELDDLGERDTGVGVPLTPSKALPPSVFARRLHVEAHDGADRLIAERTALIVPRWHAWLSTVVLQFGLLLAAVRLTIALYLLSGAIAAAVVFVLSSGGIASFFFDPLRKRLKDGWAALRVSERVPPHLALRMPVALVSVAIAVLSTSLLSVVVNTSTRDTTPDLGVAIKTNEAGVFFFLPTVPQGARWALKAAPSSIAKIPQLLWALRTVRSPDVNTFECQNPLFIADGARLVEENPKGVIPMNNAGYRELKKDCDDQDVSVVVWGLEPSTGHLKGEKDVAMGVNKAFESTKEGDHKTTTAVAVRSDGGEYWIRLEDAADKPADIDWIAFKVPRGEPLTLPVGAPRTLQLRRVDQLTKDDDLGRLVANSCGEHPYFEVVPFGAGNLVSAELVPPTQAPIASWSPARPDVSAPLLLCNRRTETNSSPIRAKLRLNFAGDAIQPRGFAMTISGQLGVTAVQIFRGDHQLGEAICPEAKAVVVAPAELAPCRAMPAHPTTRPAWIARETSADWNQAWLCWDTTRGQEDVTVVSNSTTATYHSFTEAGAPRLAPACSAPLADCYRDGDVVGSRRPCSGTWVLQNETRAGCKRVYVCQ